jgi:hypothetical protein
VECAVQGVAPHLCSKKKYSSRGLVSRVCQTAFKKRVSKDASVSTPPTPNYSSVVRCRGLLSVPIQVAHRTNLALKLANASGLWRPLSRLCTFTLSLLMWRAISGCSIMVSNLPAPALRKGLRLPAAERFGIGGAADGVMLEVGRVTGMVTDRWGAAGAMVGGVGF